MRSAVSSSFARDLDALYQIGAIGCESDRELLARFGGGGDGAAEHAFEVIVQRHGPMVWAVCRRAVNDDQTAEDAFQATFLVLALKAGSIRKQESLGPWLHGVAERIARRARMRASRRARESVDPASLATIPAGAGKRELSAAELRAVLDEEIDRLPAAYRRAIVLCYLEGKTQDAAALELGCTKGTVSGRLARAKELLRARLTRRGFAPSAGLTGILLASEDASAAVPAALARSAVRVGVHATLGRTETLAASDSAAALASGVLWTMLLGKVLASTAALMVLITISCTFAQTADRPGRGLEKRAAVQPRPAAPGQGVLPPTPSLPQYARARLGTTRLRHESFMAKVLFAPDGRTLASIGWDETIRFWDLTTGEPATKFPRIEKAGRFISAAYSPDGTRLAVGRDGVLQLWDLTAEKERFRSPVVKGGVHETVFSPDGRTLATATEESDPAVRIWDVSTGQVRRTLAFDRPVVYRGRPLSFSPDGRHLAVGATAAVDGKKSEEVIGVWDLESDGRPVVIRNAHIHTLTSLGFAPDGRTLFSGGCDSRPNRQLRKPGEKLDLSSTIRVWDTNSGRPVREFDMGKVPGHCAFAMTRDGRTFVSIHADRLIIWDPSAGKIVRTIPIERAEPGVGIGGCVAVSPDGRILAGERGDNAVHLWDLATGKPFLQQVGAHEGKVNSLAIAPDGRLIATGDDRGMVLLWDATRAAHARRVEFEGRCFGRCVALAPDGRTLAGAAMFFDPEAFGFRGIVRFWEVSGGRVLRDVRLSGDPVALAYSPDGRQVAIALVTLHDPADPPRADDALEFIQVFDIATGLKRIGLRGRQRTVYAMAFSADGRTLASVAPDMRFRFWDLTAGQVSREVPIEGHRQGAKARFPGGPTLLGAAEIASDLSIGVTGAKVDDQLLVWDLRTGRIRRTFQVGTYQDAVLALSPDARLLAASLKPSDGDNQDAAIRIWEIATKHEILRLEPKSGVRSLSFSGDGKILVSGMDDTTAIIWDCSAALRMPPKPRG
jgi:RNA polymerase sigma factor (sigma-70 family)